MESMGYIFALIAFFWCFSLEKKIKKLERLVQSSDLQDQNALALKETLEKHVDDTVVLTLYEDDAELLGHTYRITDIDEQWVQIKIERPKRTPLEKLIRLDMIKSVNIP